jgi:hypothetical protein
VEGNDDDDDDDDDDDNNNNNNNNVCLFQVMARFTFTKKQMDTVSIWNVNLQSGMRIFKSNHVIVRFTCGSCD